MVQIEYPCDSAVCAKYVSFQIDNDRIFNLFFKGGCSGNTRAISSLVDGMPIDWVIERLNSVECQGKVTSCGQELAKALIKFRMNPFDSQD